MTIHLNPTVFATLCFAVLFIPTASGADAIPRSTQKFFTEYCLECHGQVEPEAGVAIVLAPISWSERNTSTSWERIYDQLEQNSMPPTDSPQPDDEEWESVMSWLHGQLTKHSKPGGTILRRLNRVEYENSIRTLFRLSDFRVPESFPADDSNQGFDNIGETLLLSPPLMAQYLELATQVANEILPPASDPQVAISREYEIGATGLAASSATSIEGNRFRITSSKSNAHTAGWPSRFEATQSGIYQVSFSAIPFQTDSMFVTPKEVPQISIYAKLKTEQTYDPFEKIRKLRSFTLNPEGTSAQSFVCEVELYKGESFGLRWENGPYDSNDFFFTRLKQDRSLHAAMMQLGKDPRGMSNAQYFEEVSSLRESGELDLKDPRLEIPLEHRAFGEVGAKGAPKIMVNWYVHEEMRRYGPALDITEVLVEGPLSLVEDAETRASKARTARFLGERHAEAKDYDYARDILGRFLTSAFRRPVTEEQVGSYLRTTFDAIKNGEVNLEDGLHVAVRRALTSPNFLYRGIRPGPLDDFDLASRLSYFLTSSPPDDRMFQLALRGELSKPDVLKAETERLLASNECQEFVENFTGQWLGTRGLADIMPDPRLFFYYEAHRSAMTHEAELLFKEILSENLPVEAFIDPGFSYRNKHLNKIYGTELAGQQMRRVDLEHGGRQGGILGLAAVMMATANGVDTNPVHRGVWLLENVFGSPVPNPPDAVPAIASDTSGTKSIKELLAVHRSDASCARCHDKIDPLGMVMENFDPVGRWRDNYPIYVQPADGEEKLKAQFYANTGKGTKPGPPIEAASSLADGTRLNDITDMKRYLVENDEIFSTCLATKLMVYATGRPMNFGDRQAVKQLVREVKGRGNGFRDLIVSIVQSSAFQVR